MSARRLFKRIRRLAAAAFVLSLALSAWIAYRIWPQPLHVAPPQLTPTLEDGSLVMPFSPGIAVADVGSFDDQLEAYLHFEYIRGYDPEDAWRVLMTAEKNGNHAAYKIYMVVENDLLAAVPHLTGLESFHVIPRYELITWTNKDHAYYQNQSLAFESAYNLPTKQRLESLPSFQLLPSLADFLLFKSQTDWRVVRSREQAPRPLTREQARRLASDILAVAKFYSLPLDFFLGVGAMENNYMDVDGDLTHAVWKKRAERGDLILERARKRVLVSDYSIGTWQISRETLRRAHQLYLKDNRNYELLPARLRPPSEFDVNSVDSALLTTYAGLLLRDLLDRFGGDVDKAIGAYNGGVRNPNPAYASGVKTVALYARRVIGHATLSDPQSIDNRELRGELPRSSSPVENPRSLLLEP